MSIDKESGPTEPQHFDIAVLGGGPGGYTAAFRAADLGRSVVVIDSRPALGGVCLNVGCIPSKALLHAGKVLSEVEEMADRGLNFTRAAPDIDALRQWKQSVVEKLTGGLGAMARQRGVTVIRGTGRLTGPNGLTVAEPAPNSDTDASGGNGGDDTGQNGAEIAVTFDQAIIAVGSEPATLPFVPNDPRIMDSTGALELTDIPERLLVLGGGIIGLEMATVYDALGSRVQVVELQDQLVPGADRDIVKPLHDRILKRYAAIRLGTRVTGIEPQKKALKVRFADADGAKTSQHFDRILVAVGRRPNGGRIGAEAAGLTVTEGGFIPVTADQRTNLPHIFAIGDVVGQPMLAHKAVHEGKIAAEVACGENVRFDAAVIPSVAYTDPEVAWVGLNEDQARQQGLSVRTGVFPWAASGRSLSIGRSEGLTKLIFDTADDQLVGGALVGPNAGELIAEVALAIEMGATATDIGRTVHAHPTLSETVNLAAEMFEGTITDLIPPRRAARN